VVAGASGEAGNPGTLGMTILFGNAEYSSQDELSSRPERSEAEGSAVRPSGFPNSEVLTQTLGSRNKTGVPRFCYELISQSSKRPNDHIGVSLHGCAIRLVR
jgi:hypothetical protein